MLPSRTLNLLPWHGQSMVPSATLSTRHCWCVHTALKALNWPAAGWVTTTLSVAKTFPPPTGISLFVASAWLGPEPVEAALPAVAEVLLVAALHAASAVARPARPTPASAARRVVSPDGTEPDGTKSCGTM
jgi:hypothetical protein